MRLPCATLAALLPLCLAGAAPAEAGTIPYVSQITTLPSPPCTAWPVTLVVSGVFPDGCGRVVDAVVLSPTRVALTLKPFVGPDTACTMNLQSWRRELALGFFPLGSHQVEIDVAILPREPSGPREIYRDTLTFQVQERCPLNTPLPYVETIRVSPAPPCNPTDRVPCPRDSIGVCITGKFPHDCLRLVGVRLLPSASMGPIPQPPTVRLIVDDGACLGRPCLVGPVPWEARATLPPLLRGSYGLNVEVAKVSCDTVVDPAHLYSTLFPFRVDSCAVDPTTCFSWTFIHRLDSPCDTIVAPGRPGTVQLGVGSPVALAALQGQLSFSGGGLEITGLRPIGPAAGMQLVWYPAPGGAAEFVMFATQGAPIPGGRPPEPIPVLEVKVALRETPASSVVYLGAFAMRAADEQGHPYDACPTMTLEYPPSAWARICVARRCDANGDGHLDVSDLVLLIRCLNQVGPCPPIEVANCDEVPTFDLADVLCCARRLLREGCPDCPIPIRDQPGVSVSFGAPVPREHGIDLPVTVRGVELLGGARLGFRLPAGVSATSELQGGPSPWLHLEEPVGGRLVVGLLNTSQVDRPAPEELSLMLHLAMEPAGAEGAVTLDEAEFSAPDGAMLRTGVGHPSAVVGGPPRLTLGENRPNPFTGETRFALRLDRPADVEVAVYDIAGRKVASIYRGRATQAELALTWNGRTDQGGDAPGGLYFCRATAQGVEVARKMILVRGR